MTCQNSTSSEIRPNSKDIAEESQKTHPRPKKCKIRKLRRRTGTMARRCTELGRCAKSDTRICSDSTPSTSCDGGKLFFISDVVTSDLLRIYQGFGIKPDVHEKLFSPSQDVDGVESEQILVSDFAQRPNYELVQDRCIIRCLNFRILPFFGGGWVF